MYYGKTTMQRFFSIVIILGIVVIGGGYLWMKKADEEARLQIQERQSDARRSFAERARAAASQSDTDAYLKSMRSALTTYEEELKTRVYADKPKWHNPAAYKDEVLRRFEAGELKEVQKKSMLEGYDIVRNAYDLLKAGSWRPVLSKAGPGEVRLDIYEIRQIEDDDGNALLEGKFLLWGVEENTRIRWGSLALRYWTVAKEEVREGRKKVEKEVERVLGRAEGDATPRLIIQRPAQYISDFPSYISIGYLWLPRMPREAKWVDIDLGFRVIKGGAEHALALRWEKLPVSPGWQLGAGEEWDADVVEATEDEIAGRSPDEEEPTK